MLSFKEFCNESRDDFTIGYVHIADGDIEEMIIDAIAKSTKKEYNNGVSVDYKGAKTKNSNLEINFIAYDEDENTLKGFILIDVFTQKYAVKFD